MVSKTEPQYMLECLQEAVIKDVRLDGLDLVLHLSMPVNMETLRGAKQPKAKVGRLASGPFEMVFKQFHGRIPWALKGRTLGLLEEKDGAYLLETDTLEDHVVWASSLYLRLSPSAGGQQALPEGATR